MAPYPDDLTTAALDRHNGTDGPADYAIARAARQVLCTAYDALCELDSHNRALSDALTDARNGIESAVAGINAAEPECEHAT